MATLSLTLHCWSTVEYAHSHSRYCTTFMTLRHRSRYSTCSFAKKSLKKSKRDEPEASGDLLDYKIIENDNLDTSLNPAAQNSNPVPVPSRSAVLKACIITNALIANLGIVIRQLSHVASMEGLPVLDCSTEISFGFEVWHLELIIGLVVLISSCRYFLLKTWTDFAESSEAANQQYEQQGGKPLPKFGEWDVNDPASAEGFTVIFNKARDEKKTGGGGSRRVTSQRRSNSCKDDDKCSKKKWFCFRP
ncbi:RIN4, pathogenic type III effector avirulence factor Avr cleavage site [Sesbania bispinosa]|nr:RIN4, pathogenic type III effector avirulence factor Avr cleavage site [Sesbania bispinosa]